VTQWLIAIVPSLAVALVMLYVQRYTQKQDKLETKVEQHDKDLVRLDTSLNYVREHMDQMREDVKKTRQLVERLWGVVDHNPGVLSRVRRDSDDA
jgi:peptidoglycan hydrolase CwlO-like protein